MFYSNLEKRSNDSPTQSSPKKIAVESTSDGTLSSQLKDVVSLMTQQPKHKTDTNDNTKTVGSSSFQYPIEDQVQ